MATDETACAFCAAVSGRVPASVVLTGDRVVALMDIDPVTPGHVLVVPTAHHVGLGDLPDEVGAEMFVTAARVAAGIRAVAESGALRCEGVTVFLADGAAASQEVFHAHLHVFPRFPSDGFVLDGRWGTSPDRTTLDAQAAAIGRAVAS